MQNAHGRLTDIPVVHTNAMSFSDDDEQDKHDNENHDQLFS